MPQCAMVGSSSSSQRRALYGLLALYALALLLYSQTQAFTWDESYHLLAAQLINLGRKPYIDFCYPQSPLNAYWNAALMRVFGQGWRAPHASEALFVAAAVWLIADYVFVHFPVPRWRFAAAITACLATGLNAKVFLYGPVAQPYGIGLLAVVVAFRISLLAVDRRGPWLAALTGFSVGIAVASSLLTAAAAPVLLGWMFCYNRAGRRWVKLAWYCVGSVIPFTPVFWLFALGPRQTWFNVVQYHLYYRKLYWPETTRHDLEILTSWINSGPALILGLLAAFGLFYAVRLSQWPRPVKAQFYLCAWLAAALAVEVGRAHPTFPQYFLLTVPFLAILAAVGLYALAPNHARWAVILLGSLLALGLGRAVYDDRENTTWNIYQQIADKIDRVTPPHALLFADEPVYFLTRRTPPPGFELYYTHKLSLPPADAALLHIIDRAEVRRRVQSEMFVTAYSCDDGDIDFYGLKALFRQQVTLEDCTIFWDRAPGSSSTDHTPSKSTK